MALPTRTRALSLMRQMLRASRGWEGEGGIDEAIFIITETRRVFRERRHLRGAELERALEEGEERLQMARHYKIAYPRMAHVPLSGGGDVKNVLPPADAGSSSSTWAQHVGSDGVAARVRQDRRRGRPGQSETRRRPRGRPRETPRHVPRHSRRVRRGCRRRGNRARTMTPRVQVRDQDGRERTQIVDDIHSACTSTS